MKLSAKIFTLILAVVMVLSLSAFTVFAAVDLPMVPGSPDGSVKIAGDVNGDDELTDADAVYLLMHTYFSAEYPAYQDCDYNGDGALTDADAVYLLMHTYFPTEYPLN